MSWEAWGNRIERGPGGAVIAGCGLFMLACVVGIVFWVVSWFTEAGQVAKQEFGAKALLHKYEWFKDAASQLDAKVADIKVYEARFTRLKKAYEGQGRGAWSREDREQANLWEQEVAGIKASYNDLCASYNAGMAKINWRFCNAGELPQGASQVLPREFRTYKEE